MKKNPYMLFTTSVIAVVNTVPKIWIAAHDAVSIVKLLQKSIGLNRRIAMRESDIEFGLIVLVCCVIVVSVFWNYTPIC